MIMRRGLGQTDNSFGDFPTAVPAVPDNTTTTIAYPGGVASPGGSGFNWSAELASLLNQGVALAGRVVAPTTTIQRGPNGQVLIQTPSSAASGSSLLTTSSGLGISSNWLLLAGLAVVAVVAVKAFR